MADCPADCPVEGAALRPSGLLSKLGRDTETEQSRRFGLNPDGSIAYRSLTAGLSSTAEELMGAWYCLTRLRRTSAGLARCC
jgi:hypothetical protein